MIIGLQSAKRLQVVHELQKPGQGYIGAGEETQYFTNNYVFRLYFAVYL